MVKAGFPVTNKELLNSVQHTLNKAKRVTLFANNRPTETWIPKFRQRRNLSLRTAEILDPGRAKSLLMTFDNGLSIDNGWEELLTGPARSFNCNERKVLAELGSKDVYLSLKSSAKTGVSILATISASGWILDPFERSQPWMAKEKMPPGIDVFCTKKW
ncbi:hypothetical protein OUZ56_016189 [Daphnia magna]|uniref:HTH CENPB-type domain-containing protein n=1 Tax=Daphnia magna TaxID=35525 RepID=A0ABR0APZ5_9CRUS|nr:hypothetical protein OUZ56_016187 [Daphnia magna]KAK4027177.1 hypothetical protein OUZ56_016189 [Daphnia magna]